MHPVFYLNSEVSASPQIVSMLLMAELEKIAAWMISFNPFSWLSSGGNCCSNASRCGGPTYLINKSPDGGEHMFESSF